MECQENQDQREYKVSLVYREHREYKVWPDFLEQRGDLEKKENQDRQWYQEQRESEASKEFRDIKDHQDHKERGEQKEGQEQRENQEHKLVGCPHPHIHHHHYQQQSCHRILVATADGRRRDKLTHLATLASPMPIMIEAS